MNYPKATLNLYNNGAIDCPRWHGAISPSAFNRLLNEKILIDINSPRECVIGERILLEENYMLLKENRMFYECVAEITKIIKPNRIQIKMIRQLFH